MARQTKRVYLTGDSNLDQILNNLADRLDLIEGLRPELDTGYLFIKNDKDIITKTSPLEAEDVLGTENQVIVTDNGDETITLSTPQDIDTDADVVFDTSTLDKLILNIAAGLTPGEGEMSWNADDGTVNIGLPGGNVVLQVGEELLAPRSRAVGSDIGNGQLVYVSGATGSISEMTLAKADASATSRGTIAMATEDITVNQLGFFTAFGLVRDINTDPATYSEGDQLYLSGATAGNFTNVTPLPPNHIVKIGVVIRAHVTEGVILVTINQRTNNFGHILGMTANSIPHADSNGFLKETNPGFTFDGTHLKIGADNAKTYCGAGDDMSIFYDGTDGNIKTDEVAASDLLLTCGSQKTLELQNIVYEDLRTPLANAKVPAAAGPTWTQFMNDGGTSTGVYLHHFSPTSINSVYFTIQFPHASKQGGTVYPHLHWSPTTTNTGNVRWCMEYTWIDINGTFPNTSTVVILDAGDGTAYKHQIASFASFAGKNISSIVVVRLYRDASHVDDTYTGDAAALEFDVHYPIDTLGSRQEFIK